MSAGLNFEIVTPERLAYSAAVGMAVIPGREGDFGVLVGHANLVSGLRPGLVRVLDEAGNLAARIFITGGFVEVGEASCTLLADAAERVEDIDRVAAERSLADARDDLAAAKNEAETAAAQRVLAIAEARLAALSA